MSSLSSATEIPGAMEGLRKRGVFSIQAGHIARQLTSVYSEWRTFFASDIKFGFAPRAGELAGYFGLQAERALGASAADPKEFFHIYLHDLPSLQHSPSTAMLFRDLLAEADEILRNLSKAIEPLSSTGGRLARAAADPSRILLRVSHYPHIDAAGVVLAAPHEDINLLTLLPPATSGGLECEVQTGSWESIDPVPDAVTVLFGEMMPVATDGLLPSVRHRVVRRNPGDRLSLNFFVNPVDSFELAPGITAGQMLMGRLVELGYDV